MKYDGLKMKQYSVFFLNLFYVFQITSKHAAPLYSCTKILIVVAACVSQSRCPAHTQWVSELYNFTLFTGDVCSAMLRVISVGESNLP